MPYFYGYNADAKRLPHGFAAISPEEAETWSSGLTSP
jgi:hypothetical protein